MLLISILSERDTKVMLGHGQTTWWCLMGMKTTVEHGCVVQDLWGVTWYVE